MYAAEMWKQSMFTLALYVKGKSTNFTNQSLLTGLGECCICVKKSLTEVMSLESSDVT